MRYDNLLIDVVNVAYRTFTHKTENASQVGKKQIYRVSIASFVRKIEELKADYLHHDGSIYLLFDNPTSRIDLQSSFYFADRKQAYAKYKEDRTKEPREFYNSLNFIKYYYLMKESIYKTIQIPKLEADDLVEPILRLHGKDKLNLLVSTDLDWARYLKEGTVDWMSSWADIDTEHSVSHRLGFPVTETSLCIFKAIFGDPSDNIPAIATARLRPNFLPLLQLHPTIKDPLDVVNLSLNSSNTDSNPLLLSIRNQEKQYRINLQLVQAIPVGDSHIEKTLCVGRNVTKITETIDTIIGLKAEKSSFTFGNIKRPRI